MDEKPERDRGLTMGEVKDRHAGGPLPDAEAKTGGVLLAQVPLQDRA